MEKRKLYQNVADALSNEISLGRFANGVRRGKDSFFVAARQYSVCSAENNIVNLIGARRALECGIVELSTILATKEDLAKLSQFVTSIGKDTGAGSYMAELDFYLKLSEITGNRALVFLSKSIWERISKSDYIGQVFLQPDSTAFTERAKRHLNILDEMTRRDPAGARAAVQDYLDFISHLVIQDCEKSSAT